MPRKSDGLRSLVQATVHGVAKSQTPLSDFTFTFTFFHSYTKESHLQTMTIKKNFTRKVTVELF